MDKTKVTLLPETRASGSGDEGLAEVTDPVAWRVGGVTVVMRISMRQDPMASAVYREKIGTTKVDGSRRHSGARDMRAFPIKLYVGVGES